MTNWRIAAGAGGGLVVERGRVEDRTTATPHNGGDRAETVDTGTETLWHTEYKRQGGDRR